MGWNDCLVEFLFSLYVVFVFYGYDSVIIVNLVLSWRRLIKTETSTEKPDVYFQANFWPEAFSVKYIEHTDLINFPPFLYPMERFFVHEKQMIMKTDIDRNIHWALTDETTDRADIGRKFGDLTYHKGGSIVMMMQYILKYHVFWCASSKIRFKSFSTDKITDQFPTAWFF